MTIPGLTDGELSCIVPKREWSAVMLVHALANAPSKATVNPVTGAGGGCNPCEVTIDAKLIISFIWRLYG